MLDIITDKKLLSEIGNLNKKDKNESTHTARFLASYIILSQILFLRLNSTRYSSSTKWGNRNPLASHCVQTCPRY
jgi:hypothetical protein